MAPALQFTSGVRTALELVYEYRHLMGKCQSAFGLGLTMDEALTLDGIHALFAADGAVGRDPTSSLSATLRARSGKMCDEVRLAGVLLDRLELAGCPWIERGSMVEVVIEDAELRLSYRFKARVVSAREERGGAALGIELLGVPVLVRRGPAGVAPARAQQPARTRRARIAPAVAA
jgi:hypothetical protein